MVKLITRYLGIDYGSERIGLALGESQTRIAMPFGVVGSIEEIKTVIKKEDVDELVIGLPLSLGEGGGKMKTQVEEFIKELKKIARLPIIEIDERLSSKAADRLVGDKKTKAPRDAIAAMIILQSYLDKV